MKLCNFCFAIASLLSTASFGANDTRFELTATSDNFATYYPGYLGNGYVSTTTGPRGTEGNLAYLVGFMDYAKDDFARPAAVPGFSEIDYSAGHSDTGHFWLNQVDLNPTVLEDYVQTLDLHEATLLTRYRYRDHGHDTRISVTSLISQADAHIAATQLTLTPEFDGTIELSFAMNLWAAQQPRLPLATLGGDEMQEAVAAHGLKLVAVPPATSDRAAVWYHGDTHVLSADGDSTNLTLWLDGRAEQGLPMAAASAISLPPDAQIAALKLYKTRYRLALNIAVRVQRGKSYTFAKFTALSREGWGGDAKSDLALAKAARTAGFAALLNRHRAAWADLWQSDIRIDGDAEAQLAVHSDLYYLLASTTANTSWPIGACALTTGYAGHVFWDSDSWIFPALLLLHPERAKSLVMFRTRTLGPAKARARDRHLDGAMYPWEADPERGSEETPHFASVLGEREIHINADIGIAQWQYWQATHDKAWLRESGWPVIRNLADFWTSRASYNPEKKRYEIEHVTSVEENYTDIPNDTFTNASVAKLLNIATQAAALVGAKPDPTWMRMSAQMYLPFSSDGQHYLDFDESVPHTIDPWGATVLTLLTFPSLDLTMSSTVRRNDYANAMQPIIKAHEIPATMGLPPLSIAAATLGDATEAEAWLRHDFGDGLLKRPFNVRTETTSNNTGYFVTSSAAFLQTMLYGFSGLRIRDEGLVAAYAPVLPATWKSMTLKNIAFRGTRYDFAIVRNAYGKITLRRAPHTPKP